MMEDLGLLEANYSRWRSYNLASAATIGRGGHPLRATSGVLRCSGADLAAVGGD